MVDVVATVGALKYLWSISLLVAGRHALHSREAGVSTHTPPPGFQLVTVGDGAARLLVCRMRCWLPTCHMVLVLAGRRKVNVARADT